jgi:G3E family GTPase
LQSVFKTFRFTQGSAWKDGEARQSKIVFIGKNVEKESVERLFRQSLLKGDPTPPVV